jgi:TatD DNase family protein
MIVDTHCHIDLYPDPRRVLEHCVKAGVTVVAMTNLPSHFETGYTHFQSLRKVRLALGMHPLMADSHQKEFKLFINNLNKTSYIGEIGLDFSREGIATKDIQTITFTKVLEAVSGSKKVLSIHSRRAENEVLDLLKKYRIKNAIFHWYSGPLNLIDSIINEGYYFSVNTAMVRSESGRKIIAKIPLDLLLTETDGPFIVENNVPLKPGQVTQVISYISQLLNVSEKLVEQTVMSNFNRIISNLK